MARIFTASVNVTLFRVVTNLWLEQYLVLGGVLLTVCLSACLSVSNSLSPLSVYSMFAPMTTTFSLSAQWHLLGESVLSIFAHFCSLSHTFVHFVILTSLCVHQRTILVFLSFPHLCSFISRALSFSSSSSSIHLSSSNTSFRVFHQCFTLRRFTLSFILFPVTCRVLPGDDRTVDLFIWLVVTHFLSLSLVTQLLLLTGSESVTFKERFVTSNIVTSSSCSWKHDLDERLLCSSGWGCLAGVAICSADDFRGLSFSSLPKICRSSFSPLP